MMWMNPPPRSLRAVLLPGLLVFALDVHSQALPESRIWLLPTVAGGTENPLPVGPRSGYNNQPHFSADGLDLYFTTEQATGQTDIWRYRMADGDLAPVTATPESEYSPTPIPGQKALSVVRVEEGQRQRLWRVDLVTGAIDLLLPDVEPVGYHAWTDESSVALFLLGDSFTLHAAKPGKPGSRLVFSGIGRTLRKDPGSKKILFVDKTHEPWEIHRFDLDTGENEKILALFPGSEDFESGPDEAFWTGNGGKLYHSEQGNAWRLFADLTAFGVNDISRIAISPDGRWLALVGSP